MSLHYKDLGFYKLNECPRSWWMMFINPHDTIFAIRAREHRHIRDLSERHEVWDEIDIVGHGRSHG